SSKLENVARQPGRARNFTTSETSDEDVQQDVVEQDQLTVNMSDVTILRVDGEREMDAGPQYAFVMRVWCCPSDDASQMLVQKYKIETARQDRLGTLRKRKHELDHDVPADRRVLQKL
ncbi:hypothetical protein LTR66_017166, partial [Elasticomyces elasticus]